MSAHVFHECNEERYGGLAWCKVCNGAEGSLPSECPGDKMTEDREREVYAAKLDFRGGEWVELTCKAHQGGGPCHECTVAFDA